MTMHCSLRHLVLSLFLPYLSLSKPAGGYKNVEGAANDATINEAAKFAVEAVRFCY